MMSDKKKFPEFNLPDKKKKEEGSFLERAKNTLSQAGDKVIAFSEKKFGSESRITKMLKEMKEGDKDLDALSQIKRQKSALYRINLILTIILIVIILIAWKGGPDLMRDIDQLKNDLTEQKQIIKMEEQNNMFLKRLQEDKNTLMKNIYSVYAAIPDSDEKAEEVIAMLEDIATKNRMVIDSIGIRKLPESQFYYDDLWGVTSVYEYNFSVESGLPNILSFIGSLRSSLRLMDVMTLEIEEGKDSYKANFSVFAYHLMGDDELML